MKKFKIILIGILVSVVLLACLGFLGYFGVRTLRRTQMKMAAREAFDAGDWKKAEKLLNDYLAKDPDSEEDVVRLAQVYRHFGNTEEEMRCWHKASMLNPLKHEYWDEYTRAAMNARAYPHLCSALGRKIRAGEELAPRDRMLYLISAVISDRGKDASEYYERMLKEDPDTEVFEQDELGRLAKFLVTIRKLTPNEISRVIEEGVRSEDPAVRLEYMLLHLASLDLSDRDDESVLEEKEALLKEAVSMNRFVGTPILASFYYSQQRFRSVIELAEPYLADIENLLFSVLYAESCVFCSQPEKLIPLAEHFRALGPKYRMQAAYFDALYEFCQGEEKNDELVRHMQELGGTAQTDLANLINLQIALNHDNPEAISAVLERIMKSPPFYNIQERARSAVYHYLWTKTQENPAFAEDSRMVKIAQLISNPEEQDPFLTRITITDLNRRNMLNRQIIREALDEFPFDPYLLQVAAEYELFNGSPELCLEYTERFYDLKEEKRSTAFDLLHMLAKELSGQIDEAAKEYTDLVENTEMDRGILYRYFRFCIKHGRRAELEKMAERLDDSALPDLKALAPFFRAEALLLQEKTEEALALLETAQTDHMDFALHAANRFSAHDKLDQALSRYEALLDKFSGKRLIQVNIAEVYLAKGMIEEALSYARQAWESDREDELAQFVYAKMLAAAGRYQEAANVLKMTQRNGELPGEVMDLWTDIMLHCVRDDMENRLYSRAFERCNQYLLFFPDDAEFLGLKAAAEQEIRKTRDARNRDRLETDDQAAEDADAAPMPVL